MVTAVSELIAGSAPKMDSYWKRMDGLHALVDRINPEIGRVPVSGQPTREKMFALLETVNQRANPFMLKVRGGFWTGAALGGLGFGFLLFLLSIIGLVDVGDVHSAVTLGVLIGGLAGGVVGVLRRKFRYGRALAEEILMSAMERHDLSLEMFKRALKHHPGSLRHVSAAVARL